MEKTTLGFIGTEKIKDIRIQSEDISMINPEEVSGFNEEVVSE